MKRVYLDWAASTPVSEGARRAFDEALKEYGNPGSPHAEGVRAKEILESARTSIARRVGVKADGVIFTSGATEANNLGLQGYVKALRVSGRDARDIHILYLPSAHASVVETIEALRNDGVHVEALPLLDGAVDLNALKKIIRSETTLVTMDVVCGETGTRFATRDVRRVLDAARSAASIRDYKTLGGRIALHVDASQIPFVESIEHTHLGADFMTLDAQKIGGVRGIGALIRTNVLLPLEPILYGGGQEFGLRAGTENHALAKAFAIALEECEKGREAFDPRALRARGELVASITNAIPDAIVNVGKVSAPHILNMSFPKRDTDYLVMLLSEAGFDVSTKSACEIDAEGSRAVMALTQDVEGAKSTLRISWGPSTNDNDLENFAKVLIENINFLDRSSMRTS